MTRVPRATFRRAASAVGVISVVLGIVATPASAAGSVWDEDGPWGPYGWDAANGRFHQPQLGTPVPAAAPLGTLDGADFDGDGVANRQDNCLLVPNPSQQPAVPPADGPIGPADLLALAERYKSEHPNARFRTDDELGEACSGYNDNYLRTTKALIERPNTRKMEIFRFLGESGPMFGGAANPFPAGKPTEEDKFGYLGSGDLEPSPTTGDALAQDENGDLAKGNPTPSMPMCSGFEQYAAFGRWFTGTESLAFIDPWQEMMRAQYAEYEDEYGCGSDGQRQGWGEAMNYGWAGKRLYTNAEGGRITNRFVAAMTENPLYEQFLAMEPFNSLAEQSGAHPYADDASGQSRHGIIFRGKSYVDGRDAIMMDWRGFEAAWPLGHGEHIPGVLGLLIYDECRAIQTGVYNCTAVTDWVIGERRHTFQEGYMPWITKGPPSIEEYRAAMDRDLPTQ